MPFDKLLNVTFVAGEEKVELNEPLTYKIPDTFPLHALRGIEIIAPEGFVSDLASIPKIAQSVFSKLGKHRRAAVIHDELYHSGTYKKSVADLIFLYAMKDDGVNIVKRRFMYWAVKYGGFLAWRGHRKAEEAIFNNKE